MTNRFIALDVVECTGCPFDTYTGGIHECTHPEGSHLAGQMGPDKGRRDGCPLEQAKVIVRIAGDGKAGS